MDGTSDQAATPENTLGTESHEAAIRRLHTLTSGLVDRGSQRAGMANNTGIMPRTRMRHVGIIDTSEQDFILEYLRSISN